MSNVCMPLPYFFILIILIIGLILFTQTKKLLSIYPPLTIPQNVSKVPNVTTQQPKIIIEKEPNIIINKEKNTKVNIISDELIDRDRQVIFDPLKAPFRRVQRYMYPRKKLRKIINISSRGLPDNFQQIGVLTRESDEKIIRLFGRQYHPGSSQWEYYGMDEDNNKFPIENNKKELYDEDEISLNLFNQDKGNFKITLYDYNTPRYNPYDY